MNGYGHWFHLSEEDSLRISVSDVSAEDKSEKDRWVIFKVAFSEPNALPETCSQQSLLTGGETGARKGRGKRTKRKIKKGLNREQTDGKGRGGFLWPDLNIPIVKRGTIQAIFKRDHAQQDELQSEIIWQRDEWDHRRRVKVKRERGWTRNSWGGISLGPPDCGPNGENCEDFDSCVIEVKSVFNMTTKEGRKRSIGTLAAVGNGNGAAGFALGKAADRTTALRKAKNRAIQYLYYFERYQNQKTIYHYINSKFKRTTIRMKKQCCIYYSIILCNGSEQE
ncbi:28S ribosomal protein S5, mitochondrial-like [Polyodon spathula]|uniref:28S ribosomal protein S5, mitochondrial-like n=1 Tax=Polyodon spathula TaxID=7913 RepID=UPI001B7E42F3|nr:28S ribosomal protein S5, mitochondrial-like [Polyodon spathula]